jgi:hypothetical protein
VRIGALGLGGLGRRTERRAMRFHSVIGFSLNRHDDDFHSDRRFSAEPRNKPANGAAWEF